MTLGDKGNRHVIALHQIDMKKPEINDLLIGTVTALIVLLISILIAKALDILAFKPVIIGSGIFIIIILGIVGLVFVIQRTSHQEEIDTLIQRLQDIIPPTGFEWLHSDADLARIEGKVKGKDIWIVSPDLYHDLIKPAFQNLTRRNFKKGITYTYIVPKSETMQALIPALRQAYAPYSAQVKIRQVPEDDFRRLAVTHIDIYDPNMSDKEGAKVFLELPIKQRGYWVEVSQDAALGLIGRFRKIAEDENLT